MALDYMYVFGILFVRNSAGNVLPSEQLLVDRICRLMLFANEEEATLQRC